MNKKQATCLSEKRSALVKKSIIASIVIKIWSGVMVFVLASLTLLCLGVYANGVWATISTVLVWFDAMDVGLGNGLRNKLAICMAHQDREKACEFVSTTFFMLIIIVIPIMLIMLAIVNFLDIYTILNIDGKMAPDLITAFIVAIVMISGTFVFKFIGNFYMGLQLPFVSNLIVAIGQTFTVIATLAAYYAGCTSLLWIAFINTFLPLLAWLASYPLTFRLLYPDLRPKISRFTVGIMKELMPDSLKFFVLQMAGLVLFMTMSLLISRWFTPEMVTPYHLAYRYFYILLILSTIICMPFWNATTDAYEHRDMQWLKSVNKKLDKTMAAISIATLLFIVVSHPVYYLWINKWQQSTVDIPISITVMMGIYQLILIVSMRYSYFLNGISALRLQMATTLFAVVVFVPLAWMAKELTGKVESLLVVQCVVNLPGLVVNKVQTNKVLAGHAEGFWCIR